MRVTTPEPAALILPKAVLFDMDGTLTDERLDFDSIKQELGMGDGPILEALPFLSAPERERVEGILDRWEEEGASTCGLAPGCIDLLDWLEQRDVKTALITRNTRRSVETVLERHGLEFEVRLTRECLNGRYKPHPEPLLVACARLGVDPTNAWMVGDWRYDIEAGNAAGIKTVWLAGGRERPFEAVPWRSVYDLRELAKLLAGCQVG